MLLFAFITPSARFQRNPAWVRNENPVVDTHVAYTRIYNTLYANGYHRSPNTTHARELVKYLGNRPDVRSVLDVGCSTGRAVELLWESGKIAAGIDIANLAIEHAFKWRCASRRCSFEQCGGICFQVGSATSLNNLPNKSYDAIMSTDVLEHVYRQDVPKLVRSFARVARKLIIIKVASMRELSSYAKKLHAWSSDKAAHPKNLHVTTEELEWWRSAFERYSDVNFIRAIDLQMYKGYASGFTALFEFTGLGAKR